MRGLIWRSVLLSSALGLAALAIGFLLLASQHNRLLSVASNSMRPAFRAGDMLVVRPVAPSQLRVGDIVSYRSLANPKIIISHRVVRIARSSDRLITAGDNLPSNDPAIASNRVIGRAWAMAPGLGRLLATIRRPAGLVLFVYVPATLILMGEIWQAGRAYARPVYSARLEG